MLINCKNYFNEESFQVVCEALEAGKDVQIYIDCIGHTRSYYESERYKEALEKKYGKRLLQYSDHLSEYNFKLK